MKCLVAVLVLVSAVAHAGRIDSSTIQSENCDKTYERVQTTRKVVKKFLEREWKCENVKVTGAVKANRFAGRTYKINIKGDCPDLKSVKLDIIGCGGWRWTNQKAYLTLKDNDGDIYQERLSIGSLSNDYTPSHDWSFE